MCTLMSAIFSSTVHQKVNELDLNFVYLNLVVLYKYICQPNHSNQIIF